MDFPSPQLNVFTVFFKWERKYGEVFSKNYNFTIQGILWLKAIKEHTFTYLGSGQTMNM